jgi:SnoaL-like domain
MQYVTVLSTKITEDTVAHELHAEDRQAIGEILSLHGHLFDGGHLDRLGEIFTPDVVYDMSAVGVETFEGIEAIRSAALQLGPGNPVAHHVTNIVISGEGDGQVTALSKGLMLRADGTLASVTHLDTLRRHDGGWRIRRRVISPQRAPLGGAHLAGAGDR